MRLQHPNHLLLDTQQEWLFSPYAHPHNLGLSGIGKRPHIRKVQPWECGNIRLFQRDQQRWDERFGYLSQELQSQVDRGRSNPPHRVAPAVAELLLHLLQAGAGGPWKFERNKETHISIIPICSRNSNSHGRRGA